LCHRFTVFITKYNLMSKDNLIVDIVPSEEGASNAAPEESDA
jgi:hypothetical protein